MNSKRGGSLEAIFDELRVSLDPASIQSPGILERVGAVLKRLQDAPDDEKKKLKGKDAELKKGLAGIEKWITDADHLPQGTARILLAIVGGMLLIEEILEELKKLHGIK